MRAVVAVRPGPPEVLQVVRVADPVPGRGQVVVDVEVAATTFIDTQLRAGRGPRPLDAAAFPVILGNGVAGTVAAADDAARSCSCWNSTRTADGGSGPGGCGQPACVPSQDVHPGQIACSWAGLTPKHRESDRTVHRGPITKQGSTLVRWAAVEAVQKLRSGSKLRADYDRLIARRGRNIATVAAARRLLTLVYYGLRDGHVRSLATQTA